MSLLIVTEVHLRDAFDKLEFFLSKRSEAEGRVELRTSQKCLAFSKFSAFYTLSKPEPLVSLRLLNFPTKLGHLNDFFSSEAKKQNTLR